MTQGSRAQALCPSSCLLSTTGVSATEEKSPLLQGQPHPTISGCDSGRQWGGARERVGAGNACSDPEVVGSKQREGHPPPPTFPTRRSSDLEDHPRADWRARTDPAHSLFLSAAPPLNQCYKTPHQILLGEDTQVCRAGARCVPLCLAKQKSYPRQKARDTRVSRRPPTKTSRVLLQRVSRP